MLQLLQSTCKHEIICVKLIEISELLLQLDNTPVIASTLMVILVLISRIIPQKVVGGGQWTLNECVCIETNRIKVKMEDCRDGFVNLFI